MLKQVVFRQKLLLKWINERIKCGGNWRNLLFFGVKEHRGWLMVVFLSTVIVDLYVYMFIFICFCLIIVLLLFFLWQQHLGMWNSWKISCRSYVTCCNRTQRTASHTAKHSHPLIYTHSRKPQLEPHTNKRIHTQTRAYRESTINATPIL